MSPLHALLSRASLACCGLVLALTLRAEAPATQAPANTPPAELKPTSIVLLWHHQAQFAGYYMALERGFYRREGLDVTLRRGGPDVRPADELARGRTEFCVAMLASALERRANGRPLVLLSQIVNRSNFSLVAWKRPPSEPSTTIKQLSDLDGHPVSIWEADLRLPYLACFDVQKIEPDILPQYYALSLFFHHGVDACAVMRYNEYHRLIQHGVHPDDIVIFNLWEHGVTLPEDGLYTLERTWQEQPEKCAAFVKASLEGWRYARAHPEETLDVVMRYVEQDNLPTNRPHMRWMLGEILDSIFPAENAPWSLGKLPPQAFAETLKLIKRHSSLPIEPTFEEFTTPEARHVAP